MLVDTPTAKASWILGLEGIRSQIRLTPVLASFSFTWEDRLQRGVPQPTSFTIPLPEAPTTVSNVKYIATDAKSKEMDVNSSNT
jgi:hypothetical protein